MGRGPVIVVTEAGEASVTPQVLIELLSSAIMQAVQCDDFEGPTCSYIAGALNVMGKLGLLELSAERAAPGKSSVDTSQPPGFLSDAFKFGGEGANETDRG